jgi:transposase
MVKRYRVTLEDRGREDLEKLVSSGKGAARKLAHARVLLLADQSEGGPGWKDADIAQAVSVSVATVERVRQRFVEQGTEAALVPKPTSRRYERKLDGAREAQLIALACSQPPQGRAGWTMRLLADAMVGLEHVESLSHETVRQVLKKVRPSRG